MAEKQTQGLTSYDTKLRDPVTAYLGHVTYITEFCKLYFGHWHSEWEWDKYRMLYQDIVRIV